MATINGAMREPGRWAQRFYTRQIAVRKYQKCCIKIGNGYGSAQDFIEF
jgi:hypothetical protein